MYVKRFLLLFCLGPWCFTGRAQTGINTGLKRELDSVMASDGRYREALSARDNKAKADSFARLYHIVPDMLADSLQTLQNVADSLNLRFIAATIKRYGYPGKSLVGEPTNQAAWDVLQHSAKFEVYLPAVKKAADDGEIPFRLYALLLDHALLNHKKEQIYGSQVMRRKLKTGRIVLIVWPIKNPAQVDDLRRQAGFDSTVEANALQLGVVYKVYKLADVEL